MGHELGELVSNWPKQVEEYKAATAAAGVLGAMVTLLSAFIERRNKGEATVKAGREAGRYWAISC